MPRLRPCWSCQSTKEDCFIGCQCAKCVDPDGYLMWKTLFPEEYQRWVDRNTVSDGMPTSDDPRIPLEAFLDRDS